MFALNKPPALYWSIKQKANWLERCIIIHSILYYEMHENIIEDFQFDKAGKQLLKYKKQLGQQEFKQTEYYYVFKDFDASTGFYIYDRLNKCDKKYLTMLAEFTLRNYKRGK